MSIICKLHFAPTTYQPVLTLTCLLSAIYNLASLVQSAVAHHNFMYT